MLLKLFLFFDIQSRMFGTASSLTDSNLEIIMLIAGEDVVRNAIFKNALIPFTCGQFSESTTLRRIRMQLLCSRRFTSNAFLLYLSHFQEAIFLFFWNFLVIVRLWSNLAYTLLRFLAHLRLASGLFICVRILFP